MEGVKVELVKPAGSVLAFVLNSWLESYRERGRAVHEIDRPTFYRTHHPEVTRLVERNRLAFATLDADPDAYLGWACGAPGVLHYVYVKHAYRECGLGNLLVAAVADTPRVYTFEPGTKSGELRRAIVDVATRKGWKYHAHPVPGVLVHKQLQAQREST